jgi:proteasome alpha subunit
MVSEEKSGTKNLKMAIIDHAAHTMRKVEEEDLEKYAAMAKERAAKRPA